LARSRAEVQDEPVVARLRRQSWFGVKRHVKRFFSLEVPNTILRGFARFVPRLRSGRLPAPDRLAEVTGRVAGETFVMLDPARCENAKELFWGEGRRPKAHDRLALDTVAALAREADVFLDIGAYTGLFTLATTAVAPTLRAHAFEIVPSVVDTLEANLRRNEVDGRVTVHREGIGEPGTTIRVPAGEGGSGLPSFYSSRMAFDEGEDVRFRSLDSVGALIPAGARVVIKIDVEGTEDAVFGHGQQLLATFRPDVLCEVLPEADGEHLDELLAATDLRRYLVTNSKLAERDRIEPDADFRDWLFSPRTPDELRELGLPAG
jgi:FkbM family methyltransferase